MPGIWESQLLTGSSRRLALSPGQTPEFSGLERILARHEFPEAISLSPKPSYLPLWKRKGLNHARHLCEDSSALWESHTEPPLRTVMVR